MHSEIYNRIKVQSIFIHVFLAILCSLYVVVFFILVFFYCVVVSALWPYLLSSHSLY